VRQALALVVVFVSALLITPSLIGATHDPRLAPLLATCSSGYVDGIIGGEQKCLRAGEFCAPSTEADYERYGFSCIGGHLQSGISTPASTSTTTAVATTVAQTTTRATTTSVTSTPINLGKTVLLRARAKTSGCALGPLPDRRCSPGAYYSGLTKAVICASTFRTGPIRNVPDTEKHQVELEYGLAAKGYGSTLEIDHIVSLELGGSNDPANLFPEEATLAGHAPGFHVKDKLENAVHKAVCAGTISLRLAQQQIASNWEQLYKKLLGVAPSGS
jgi:hypothetical protein